MIDKERWNIERDLDRMEKLIKHNILVQYKKCIYIYIQEDILKSNLNNILTSDESYTDSRRLKKSWNIA